MKGFLQGDYKKATMLLPFKIRFCVVSKGLESLKDYNFTFKVKKESQPQFVVARKSSIEEKHKGIMRLCHGKAQRKINTYFERPEWLFIKAFTAFKQFKSSSTLFQKFLN